MEGLKFSSSFPSFSSSGERQTRGEAAYLARVSFEASLGSRFEASHDPISFPINEASLASHDLTSFPVTEVSIAGSFDTSLDSNEDGASFDSYDSISFPVTEESLPASFGASLQASSSPSLPLVVVGASLGGSEGDNSTFTTQGRLTEEGYVVAAVFLGLIGILGIFNNLAVLTVMAKNKQVR